ncbi:MAG: MG2 domain-containing protein, partial [Planctomycetales bacterium]
MHLARGIEGLDVALIDPDKSWTFEVPDYVDYRQLVREIEIPLGGPGVAAVTVSHEPQADDSPTEGIVVRPLESTTMVMQSDLDVLVKCSRNELFVFAQNMRTGKPFPNVKLLISDGSEVFAEATTGADGVFLGKVSDENKTFDRLKTSDDVRVFALVQDAPPNAKKADAKKAVPKKAAPKKAGDAKKKKRKQKKNKAQPKPDQDAAEPAALPVTHVASSVVGLSGLDVAQGVSPTGYLYTDRPAYRAGQVVNVRGIVRWVKDDQYVFEPGKKFRLDVYDSRDRRIRGEETTLGEFGAFALRFMLPERSPQGDYRLHLHDPADPDTHDYHG